MNCQSVRNWLLQVESLQPKDWPPEVVKHLKSCAVCVKYVNALLDADEGSFRKGLQAARLSPEERASGEHLLESARKLAASDDLEEDEEIVTDVAEKLLDRARDAQSKGSEKESEQCGRRYSE